MSTENTNVKSILDKLISNKNLIAFVAIAFFLGIIIWIIATQYDVNTTSVCLSITGKCNITIVNPPPSEPVITPFQVSIVSGGISTVALGVLIGIGFLEFPIIFALAGGAAFATLTYGILQILY